MPTPSTSVSGSSKKSLNNWIYGELQKLAAEKGISQVPMKDPNFDFYGYTERKLKALGFKGFDLEAKVSDTIMRLFLDMEEAYTEVGEGKADSIGKGPLLRSYDPTRGTPFDAYFKNAVNNRAKSESRDRSLAQENMPTTNIHQGGGSDGEVIPGVAEEALGGGESDHGDSGMDLETKEYIDHNTSDLENYLLTQRHGRTLVLIYKLTAPIEFGGSGMSQGEMTQYLNDKKIPSESGATSWTPGMVSSYVMKLRKAVENWAMAREEAGDSGFMDLIDRDNLYTTKDNETKPGQIPAPPANASPTIYWYPGGDATQAQAVLIVRRSAKNSRIKLPSGEIILVPTNELRSE